MSSGRLRLRYAVLAALTILIGLGVHLHGRGLPPAARDILADALWAAMVFWIISAIAPRAAMVTRGAAALAIAFAVELSQLIGGERMDALRGTSLGHLVLGSDFDARDLLAYTAGVAAAILLDRFASRHPS